jgi:teichoic acid transport system permease protein
VTGTGVRDLTTGSWLPAAARAGADGGAASPAGGPVLVDGLVRVGARPPLPTYLRGLWDRRHFLWREARAKVASGTRETVLGQAWLVVRPVVDGLAYFVVFGLLLGVSRGIPNFPGYLIVGVFLFSFTAQCVTSGTRSVRAGRNLVRAFTFPRAALPLSVVLQNLLTLVPTLVAMLGLLRVLPDREPMTWHAVAFPLVLVLQTAFVTGLTLVVARLGAALPDLNQVVAVAMRLWLYGSAVFFSFDRFVEHPRLLELVQANPMFLVLDASRDCLLYGRAPAPSTWLGLTAWALGSLVVGLLVFWHGEESYARD